jgi:hypothetical protein
LTGVPIADITGVYQARDRLQQIVERPADALERKVQQLALLLRAEGIASDHVGVTGSILVNQHRPGSDIDLVIYDRAVFRSALHAVQQLCTSMLQTIPDHEWPLIYARRGCSLTFDEFVWHERRKWNKAMIGGTKFDLSLVTPEPLPLQKPEKLGIREVVTRIVDASAAFDYPARYQVDSPLCQELISFTQTYAGQALAGETVCARGSLERCGIAGVGQLIIGDSREATGQFLKVLRAAP